MSHGHATHAHDSHGAHGGPGHVVPIPILAGVWLALMVLTVITVQAAYVNFGSLNLWIAMGIATVKASLVVLFFMHLFWDRPINAVIFVLSLALVTLFIGIALTDSTEYQPQLIPGYAPAISANPAAGQ